MAVNGNGVLENPFTDPPHDENDLCVALKLEYQGFEFFMAGDLSGKNTSSYTDIETSVAPEVGKIEVLQVDHHGSNNNTNQCFLDSLQPQVAVISVVDGDITIKVCSDSFWVNGDGHPVSVGIDKYEQSEMIPKGFILYQNYPNPFNMETEISYDLPKASYVRLEVYNILGQNVISLVDGKQKAGYKTAKWDASSLSSGTYFYKLKAGDFVQTRKMVLLQ